MLYAIANIVLILFLVLIFVAEAAKFRVVSPDDFQIHFHLSFSPIL